MFHFYFIFSIFTAYVRIVWISLSHSKCVRYCCPSLTNHSEMENSFRALRNRVQFACVWERPKFFHDASTKYGFTTLLLTLTDPCFSCAHRMSVYNIEISLIHIVFSFFSFRFGSIRFDWLTTWINQFAHQLKIIYTFDQIIFDKIVGGKFWKLYDFNGIYRLWNDVYV